MFKSTIKCCTRKAGPFTLMASIALSVFTVGCGGGGSSSSGDNLVSGITSENVGEVAAMAYGVVEMVEGFAEFGDALPGEDDFSLLSLASVQTPEGKVRLAALQVSRQSQDLVKVNTSALTTIPCDSGSFSYSVSGSTTTISYNNCEFAYGGVTSSMNGTTKYTEKTPATGYSQSFRHEFQNLSYSYKEGSDSMSGTMNGWQEISYSSGDNAHIQANLSFSYSSHCQDVSDSMAGSYQFTMVSQADGSGMAYTINGQMTVTSHPTLSGTYSVQTLEPIRYATAAYYPYAGKIKVSASDGSSTTIEYVEGGLFVDSTFYTWLEFEALYLEEYDDVECFM